MIVQRIGSRSSRRQLVSAGMGLGAAAVFARIPSVLAQEGTPGAAEEARAIIGDVVDFTLTPEDRWDGPFSSVTLKLHPGWFNGGDAWFIRTDASDQAFAEAVGLVYVPLLQNALEAEGSYATIYRFADGADGQRPVLSTTPTEENFTSAFQVVDVTFSGEPEALNSETAIVDAASAGTVSLTPTGIIVNYPLVVWPDGGLAVDPDLTLPLGPGPLIEPPDLENGLVTFKLHQCYPGSRYIATDTSAGVCAGIVGVR